MPQHEATDFKLRHYEILYLSQLSRAYSRNNEGEIIVIDSDSIVEDEPPMQYLTADEALAAYHTYELQEAAHKASGVEHPFFTFSGWLYHFRIQITHNDFSSGI